MLVTESLGTTKLKRRHSSVVLFRRRQWCDVHLFIPTRKWYEIRNHGHTLCRDGPCRGVTLNRCAGVSWRSVFFYNKRTDESSSPLGVYHSLTSRKEWFKKFTDKGQIILTRVTLRHLICLMYWNFDVNRFVERRS